MDVGASLFFLTFGLRANGTGKQSIGYDVFGSVVIMGLIVGLGKDFLIT